MSTFDPEAPRLVHDGLNDCTLNGGLSGRNASLQCQGTGPVAHRLSRHHKEKTMDKDRVEGAGKNLKGKIKEGFGKATGDAKTEAEGKTDQAEGKVQNTVGGVKDKAREVLDDK
jgi:uncharacterized protein YjbJ (UPF0337 family)